MTRITASLRRTCKLANQVENLRLNRDVERGGRLVGDEQLRLARQRHRDHHPLAHPAGELMRIIVDAAIGVGDSDQAQRLDRALRVSRRAVC